MTDGVAQDLLQSIVRRIENLDDEIKVLNDDKASVYKEAKADGFDVKVLRKIISDRRKDVSERMEFDEVYDLYAAALGMLPSSERGVVRAHVENIERFDPETGEIEQPETANSSASVETTSGIGSASDASAMFHPGVTDGPTTIALQAGTVVTDRRDGQPIPEPVIADQHVAVNTHGAGEGGATPALPATQFPAYDAPTALSSEVVPFRAPKPLRPHCLNPQKCGGQGKKHCWSCESQMGETSTGGNAA